MHCMVFNWTSDAILAAEKAAVLTSKGFGGAACWMMCCLLALGVQASTHKCAVGSGCAEYCERPDAGDRRILVCVQGVPGVVQTDLPASQARSNQTQGWLVFLLRLVGS